MDLVWWDRISGILSFPIPPSGKSGVSIGARSTTVVTNDNIAIIIPNSRFIAEEAINWSCTGAKVRFRVPVAVSCDSDVRLVERLLLEAARENRDVPGDPEPAVRFLEFGDSGLNFELRDCASTLIQRNGKLVSALNFAILERFREHGVEIPCPQRDPRVKGGNLKVRIAGGSGA
jgi:small-conductance mechanosensitive channel